MSHSRPLLASLLVLGLTGCSRSSAPPPSEPTAPVQPTRERAVAASTAPAPTALAAASNGFGIALWTHLPANTGNFTLSPASIAAALAMTAAGARGETAAQLATVLGPVDGAAWAELFAALQDPARGAGVRVANRLFGERTYTFQPDFMERTARDFGAPLAAEDFRGAPTAARDAINAWVAERTERRILELLPLDGVTADTRLILVNALYFLAKWAEPFEPSRTSPTPFRRSATDVVEVATMNLTTHLRVGSVDGATVLELPYRGGTTAMVVVVPEAVDGLAELEAGLAPDSVERWVAALGTAEKVWVSLPRFEVKPGAPMRLKDPLVAMGAPLAFDPDRADFRGIADPPSPGERLVVSDVFHSAFVRVDEAGTEAAAATAVAMAEAGSAPLQPRRVQVDRPFLFVILDTSSGVVLFLGRVVDPS